MRGLRYLSPGTKKNKILLIVLIIIINKIFILNKMEFKRNTRQRQVILEELQKATSHPTAKDLYKVVQHRLPNISLATVYRNLDFLSQKDIIQKLDTSGKEARFDCNPYRHYHVRCINCGRVDNVHDLSADILENITDKLSDYEILGHRLEFFGVCPDCKKTSVKTLSI